MDRVVRVPLTPALLDQLARLEVEGDAKAKRRPRIRIVGGRHTQVHDAVALLAGELFLLPHLREEAPDAPVVQALRKAPAARLAARVVAAGSALRRAILGE